MLARGRRADRTSLAPTTRSSSPTRSRSRSATSTSTAAPRRRRSCSSVVDAGGGAGTWTVEMQPAVAAQRRSTSRPGARHVAPGGDARLPVTARAAASAAAGDNYGFLVLRRGTVTRAGPVRLLRHAARRSRTAPVRAAAAVPDRRHEQRRPRASVYRFPAAAFGPPPNYTGAPVLEDGAESCTGSGSTSRRSTSAPP